MNFGRAPGPGEVSMPVAGVVEQMIGLEHVRTIGDNFLALAMARPFSDREVSLSPDGIANAPGTATEWQRLRDAGELPDDLQTLEAFREHCRMLTREIPAKLGEMFIDRADTPPQLTAFVENLVAGFLAQGVYKGWVQELSDDAGVQVSVHPEGRLVRTLSGLEYAVPHQTGVIIEHGAGLAGGLRRIHEVRHDVWDTAHLTNAHTFACRFAGWLALLYKLAPDRVRTYDTGMAAAGESLLGADVQADIITLAKVRHAPPEEVSAAIRSAPDLLVAGGALVVSDFLPHAEQPTAGRIYEMINEAAEVFGAPAVTHDGEYRVGEFVRPMRDAIFVKSA